MSRIIHFELSVDDPQRALNFYQTVFGWKAQQFGQEQYWLVSTGTQDAPGIDGAILPRRGNVMWVNTLAVADVDTAVAKVEANGGKVVVPKMGIPGVGWLVYCHDTEGNVFGMAQNDPNAK